MASEKVDPQLLLEAPKAISKPLLPPGASHNTYGLFVKDETDLIGLVAYSLYKSHKIAFLAQQHDRTGKRATQEEVDTFCSVYNTAPQVEMLRDRASDLLEVMTGALLQDAVQHINSEYDKKLVAELKEGQGWWKSLGQGVVGNFVFAGLLALLLFIAMSSQIGIIPTLANWSGYTATPKNPP